VKGDIEVVENEEEEIVDFESSDDSMSERSE
jgi:hypothetical protein